jgi:hypothetical protein
MDKVQSSKDINPTRDDIMKKLILTRGEFSGDSCSYTLYHGCATIETSGPIAVLSLKYPGGTEENHEIQGESKLC